ncbi:MAG: putative collagen-binding domain-containing protein [Armatimonadota bacterium]|nr:putative collagen-binding domain-containing protein [Armatimonadota bacterium]
MRTLLLSSFPRRGVARFGAACLMTALLAGSVLASPIGVHPSKRYLTDASGKPVFFIGYYCWASVAPGYYNDSPQRYSDMIVKGAPYGINYLRFSLGINALGGEGTNYWERDPTPIAFQYVNGKVDLDKWNPVFWSGLRYHAELARRNGVMLHVCLFDGVDYRGGTEKHRWINSFWNVKDQVKDYYGDLDVNQDGNADENGEFYRANDFRNNTGVGRYQRKLIDKALAVTEGYDNVFFEIGNELLGSRADWNAAVIDYVKRNSGKIITQSGGRLAYNADGWCEHNPNSPADVKKTLDGLVGRGCLFWLDPDGSDLMEASPDDLRRCVWYSFTGGAAGWGGFGDDYWERAFSLDTVTYHRNLAKFIKESGVKFWEMTPQHGLVSNNKVNSCLAKTSVEYVVYVLNDETVRVDLRDVTDSATYRLYDPKTGVWAEPQTVRGGAVQTFTKPPGADDWVIHVRAVDLRGGAGGLRPSNRVAYGLESLRSRYDDRRQPTVETFAVMGIGCRVMEPKARR